MEDKKEKTKLKIREALAFGWKKTNQRLGFFVVASFIFVFVPLLITPRIDIVAALAEGLSGHLLIVFSGLIYFILSALFTAGFLTILLKTLREERPSFRDFLGKWKYVPRLVGGYILYFLALLAGLNLLIVPGLILSVRLYFFNLLIIDKGMGPIRALKESYAMTKGYGWKIFLLVFVVVPILFVLGVMAPLVGIWRLSLLVFGVVPILFVLGVMALLVGILVAISVVCLASVFFYGKLSNREVESTPVQVS